MKRKKSPILILTALIVCVCLAAFLNDQSRRIAMTPEQLEKESQKAQEKAMQENTASLPTTTKEQMSAKLEGAKGATGAKGAQPNMVDMMKKNLPPQMRDKLSVERRKAAPGRMAPNDSSIAGQWYDNEHYQTSK